MELEKLIFKSDKSGQRVPDVDNLLVSRWGSEMIVSRGKVVDAGLLSRITVMEDSGKLVGLATFQIDENNGSCEIVSVDSLISGAGIGSKLLAEVEDEAGAAGCRRMWLITLNDNPEAAAFYIKRGYKLVAVHLGALIESRKLKPQLPLIGKHGIQLHDEWELEKII
jgi:GNAT superfamily N-acetyltransferase